MNRGHWPTWLKVALTVVAPLVLLFATAPVAQMGGEESGYALPFDGVGGYATRNHTASILQPGMAGEDAGYALQFDGIDDYVTLSYTSSILQPGWETTKTVSLWVKPTGQPNDCDNSSALFCDAIFGDRSRWWGIGIGSINGDDKIWVFSVDYSGPGSVGEQIGVSYTLNQWVHVTLVHGNGMLSAYRNGVLVDSVPSEATQQPTGGAQPILHLGGIINTAVRNWTFKGEIDEVSLWDYPRSQAEIQADMLHSLTGTETGLRAYYKMSDGSGTSLTDDSGNGWMGTFREGLPPTVPGNGALPEWVPSSAFDYVIYTVFLPISTRD
jgi:hypothetical protein